MIVRPSGVTHSRWAGGELKRNSNQTWLNKRKEVLVRDNFTCQKCGYKGNYTIDKNGYLHKSKLQERLLHTHHITGYRYEKSDPDNTRKLITLCAPCHISEEWLIHKTHREEPFVYQIHQKEAKSHSWDSTTKTRVLKRFTRNGLEL